MVALKRNSFIKRYLPWLSFWLLLLIMTSIPGPDLPKIDIPASDKYIHFTAYAVLAYLALRAFAEKTFSLKISVLTFLYCTAYGAFDEFHQQFIPGRSMELLDFVADSFGAIIGIILRIFLVRVREVK